jgi:trehalose utilization protein
MDTSFPDPTKIATAVVTGQHDFDVPAFHTLFRSLPDIDFYLQDLANLVADTEQVFDQYDVLLFYNFHRPTPEGKARAMLERLGMSQQGIVVLHHALLAFPQWTLWRELVGIDGARFSAYDHDQTVHIEVADADHPITQGMASWTMIDETYTMADADPDNHILLTTDHPKNMRTVAWTRQYGRTRVFCCECGHDRQTYVDPNFRALLRRGIQWAAGRI